MLIPGLRAAIQCVKSVSGSHGAQAPRGLTQRAGAVASNTYLAAQSPGGIQLDKGTLALSNVEAAKSGSANLQARFRLGVPPGADNSYRLGCMCARALPHVLHKHVALPTALHGVSSMPTHHTDCCGLYQ